MATTEGGLPLARGETANAMAGAAGGACAGVVRSTGALLSLPWIPWVTLAFGVSIVLILVLVPSIVDDNFWPLVLGAPIILFPLPLIFVNVGNMKMNAWGKIGESFSICVTGFVLSAIVGIPLLLHHNNIVTTDAMWFIFGADVLITTTVVAMGVCFGAKAKRDGGFSAL